MLDVTHIVAGPFCSMILADMGAEVIKIERPGVGERGPFSNGPFIDGPGCRQRVSSRYLGLNRNKKSVSIDLRDLRCKQAFERMVAESDVLLDNWGPGALRRLGLGFDQPVGAEPAPHLRQPYRLRRSLTARRRGHTLDWPANNPCVQGMGGWMTVTGGPESGPQMVGDNIGDSVPGVWTALAIMMALESRHRTGRGQYIDMAMYDCMVAHMTSTIPLLPGNWRRSRDASEATCSARSSVLAGQGRLRGTGRGGRRRRSGRTFGGSSGGRTWSRIRVTWARGSAASST